jgi:hypothetical protein
VETNQSNFRIYPTDIRIPPDIRFSVLASWYYAEDIDTDIKIRMLADVRWVGFLPPVGLGQIRSPNDVVSRETFIEGEGLRTIDFIKIACFVKKSIKST